jgi:hypothetical protein
VLFDGTSFLSYALTSASTPLDAANWAAVSFQVAENDPTCGPGRYSLTQLSVALGSLSGAASVSIQVQLYSTDVRCGGGG